jgi:hypothetical protein
MAYKPTGLTKALIAVVALGLIGSVGWNFFLKDKFKPSQGGDPMASVATGNAPAATGTNAAPTPSRPQVSAASSALGSAGKPLRVSLVSFHGYAPALVANGNSLTTKAGSIYDKLGVNV